MDADAIGIDLLGRNFGVLLGNCLACPNITPPIQTYTNNSIASRYVELSRLVVSAYR